MVLQNLGNHYPYIYLYKNMWNLTVSFELYEIFLNKYQNSNIKILEIGVFNGDSLKIWREYFTNAIICGFDIDDKKISIPGVDILIGDQTDPIFLSSLLNKYKNFDIIIDDGSHVSKHIINHLIFFLII